MDEQPIKRKRGRPKGIPKTGGRTKGTPNKVTRDSREAARAIIEDLGYRTTLVERSRAGTLPPAVECMLWHYAYGKPVERHSLTNEDGMPAAQIVVSFVEPNGSSSDKG